MQNEEKSIGEQTTLGRCEIPKPVVKEDEPLVDWDPNQSIGEMETLQPPKGGIRDDGRTDGARRWKAGEEILGRYVVDRELGQGGMGVVYACLDKVGGVKVAVKSLPPEVGHDEDEMDEVRDNFQLVYKLSHPNIAGVKVLERDLRGEYHLVMEMAEGESLRRWMRRKRKEGGIAVEDAVPVLRQVASALDYAHSEKVVHRDIKPGNVMIDGNGKVKVLDFGLAAQIRSSLSRVSREKGRTSGTRLYMAPEQWEGQAQDARTDQYALAVMAYEMLAGRLPFEGDDPEVLRGAVLKGQVRDIQDLDGDAMNALRRALAKNPADRFGSCGEFVAALAGKTPAQLAAVSKAGKQQHEKSGGGNLFLRKIRLGKALEAAERQNATPEERAELSEIRELFVAGEEALRASQNDEARALHSQVEESIAAWQKKLETRAAQERAEEEARKRREQEEAERLLVLKQQELERERIRQEEDAEREKARLEMEAKKKAEEQAAERQRTATESEQRTTEPPASNTRTGKTSKWGWVVSVGVLVLLCVAGAIWKGDQGKTVQWYLDAASKGDVEAQLHLGKLYEEGHDVSKSDEEAFKWYQKAAEQGNAEAQNHLGEMYEHGRGISQSEMDAVEWYRKAAQQGYAAAEHLLSIMYFEGHGVERNYVEAAKWCRMAAVQDNAAAQHNLGVCYLNGHGVRQSDAEAVKWFRKAAEHGNANGQAHLAFMFAEGRGVEQNADEADKLYRQAADGFRKEAEQGNDEAQQSLGWLYEKGLGVQQSDSEAVMWYRKAAEQGNAFAQYNLGGLYMEGRGVNQSEQEAVKWYQKAAEQGDAEAQFTLGLLYIEGRGVNQSDEEAAKWFRKAAEQEMTSAEGCLGSMYDAGRGVVQSDAEAAKWYKKAAEKGDAESQACLGEMYVDGRAGDRNVAEAVKWFKMSAEQGNPRGQVNLGAAYENGWGVRQDHTEALKWYQKAAEQGYAVAQEFLSSLQQKSGETKEVKPNNNRLSKSSSPSIFGKLQRIIIPSVEFRQANIADIANYLMDASIAADPSREGIRIVLALGQVSPSDLPPITLNLRNINMQDTITAITKAAGLKWKVADNAVIITPGYVIELSRELAKQEEIRAQAAEADALKAAEEGFRYLSAGNNIAAEKSFTKALDLLPDRPQNSQDRSQISWGLAEAKYLRARANLQQQVRYKESRALINDALKLAPDHSGAIKLDQILRKLGY